MVSKITKYNEELLKDIDSLDGWPDKVKIMQKTGLINLKVQVSTLMC